jgi:hypothetical protein
VIDLLLDSGDRRCGARQRIVCLPGDIANEMWTRDIAEQ